MLTESKVHKSNKCIVITGIGIKKRCTYLELYVLLECFLSSHSLSEITFDVVTWSRSGVPVFSWVVAPHPVRVIVLPK